MYAHLLLLLLSMLSFRSYTQTAREYKVERGVSKELAIYRRQALSNLHYDISLKIPAILGKPVTATETIGLTVSDSTRVLEIDFKERPEHVKLMRVNDREVDINFKNEHLPVDGKRLRIGHNTIFIEFIAGNLSLNRNNDYLYTLLVPDRARTLFPCFDQPDLKGTFTLTLSLPNSWKAVGNAPLIDSSVGKQFKQYRYSKSDTISTYLFSFVAGVFDSLRQGNDGQEMNFYHRETDTNKINFSVDSIFRLHRLSFQYMHEYTGILYPFKKFDFVAVPDFQYGGMEHVGAIDYRASTLFLDSGATKDQLNARANLIAHETAHMWFGNLVTMRWFNDVWMKEVFANFMADKIGQQGQASDSYELKFLLDHVPAAYAVDRTRGANPIRQQLDNLQEAGTLYGNIIYHKAPVMMRQLERLMGKEAFKAGLREYLASFKFRNASWADLISILQKYTSEDLKYWNQVWVNKAGRPVFTYQLQQKRHRITRFTISQAGEYSKDLLPQFFDITLVYKDTLQQYSVFMNKHQLDLRVLKGKGVPQLILFNSSALGYGLFPIDKRMLPFVTACKDPVTRASAYINLYENMLSGNGITPLVLLRYYMHWLLTEPEELNVRLLTNHMVDIYWRLVPAAARIAIAGGLEKKLWDALMIEPASNKKKLLFKAYQNVALTRPAKDTLYRVWKTETPPRGVKLTEEDYTALSLSLAVKAYPARGILAQQATRIRNIDRRQRLQFIMPALSNKIQDRDRFFLSLKLEKNRQKEAWVILALEYLHHPLRAATSVKYLLPGLEMLQEIQSTGDIFFPGAWLQSSFGNYHSKRAADVVSGFLKAHPRYNPKLKAKILQTTDALFRAEKLVRSGK